MTLLNTSYVLTNYYSPCSLVYPFDAIFCRLYVGHECLEKTINETHNQYFTTQDVIEMLKSTPTIIIAILYYINRWKYRHQVLGRF